MTTIPLVPCPPKLATSYGTAGGTRDGRGQPYRYDRLIRVEAFQRKAPLAWRCPAGMARDLLALDDAIRSHGGSGLRLTELARPVAVITEQRRRYEAWVQAGRPQPGEKGFAAQVMRTSFVRKANETFHQPGFAVDLDVYALDFPDVPEGDAQLAKLWELAIPLGFLPIIAHPSLDQSECWHFDHLGPLREVFSLVRKHKHLEPYRLTAEAACILTGTYAGARTMERLVQARLLLAGQWVGELDGVIGKNTRAALAAVGIEGVTGGTAPSIILGLLDEKRVGTDAMEAA